MLQKNGNHNTFRVRNIDIADRPDLFDRFNVEQTPTIVVVYHGKIAARMDTYKKNVEVAKLLSPWILTFDGRYGPKNSWKHYTSRS
jgi:thioredoxin-like negative regulator of GroEL